jgi:hypothetical protein
MEKDLFFWAHFKEFRALDDGFLIKYQSKYWYRAKIHATPRSTECLLLIPDFGEHCHENKLNSSWSSQ